jgi:hypothetical protein
MVTNFSCQVFPDSIRDDFDFPDAPLSQHGICGPHAIMTTATIEVPATDIESVVGTTRRWYAWGWVEYDDVFDGTPRHRTEFCFEISVTRRPVTNELFMAFLVDRRFNAADQDCLRPPPLA